MIIVPEKRKLKSQEEEPAPKPAYFWWFLANVLALCFALISWAVCFNLFGNPEIPRNFEILKKLGRLPELQRYTVLDVPNGNALSANELYGKYFGLEGAKLDRLNSLLMRNYMSNFSKNLLLTYVEGEYKVTDVRKLDEKSFMYPGFAVRAQAMVRADDFTEPAPFPVVIEYLFPTEKTSAVDSFRPGDILEINKNPNCAAVIHASKIIVDEDPALLLSVVPIAYGPYRAGNSQSFHIEPPKVLNPKVGLPIWK